MKKLMIFILFFTLSCNNAFKDKMVEIDNNGRDLDVTITAQTDEFQSFQNSVNIKVQANDKLEKIVSLKIKINNNPYQDLTILKREGSQVFSEYNLSLLEKTNRFCAKVTTNSGGTKENCIKYNKPFKNISNLTNRFYSGSCAYHKNDDKMYCASGLGQEYTMRVYDFKTQNWTLLDMPKVDVDINCEVSFNVNKDYEIGTFLGKKIIANVKGPLIANGYLTVKNVAQPRKYAKLVINNSKIYIIEGISELLKKDLEKSNIDIIIEEVNLDNVVITLNIGISFDADAVKEEVVNLIKDVAESEKETIINILKKEFTKEYLEVFAPSNLVYDINTQQWNKFKKSISIVKEITGKDTSARDCYSSDINGAGFEMTSCKFSDETFRYGRIEPSTVILNSEIYVMGGGHGTPETKITILDHVESIDINNPNAIWKNEERLKQPRGTAVAFTHQNKIYIFGGYNNNQVLNSMEIYDGSKWTKPNTSMIEPRMLASGGLVANNYIYLIGGLNFKNRVSLIERYNLIKGRWDEAINSDYQIADASFIVKENDIYLIGGELYANDNYMWGAWKDTSYMYKYSPILD